MDWCIANNYEKANHNPHVILNGNITKEVIYLNADGRKQISLSAAGTTDPDGNNLNLKWWIYPEAGTIEGAFLHNYDGEETIVDLSGVTNSGTLHVILQVNDDGEPNLYAYRRVVISMLDE